MYGNNGNCTAYAWGRVSEIAGTAFSLRRGNAIDFAYSSALYQIKEPQYGAVIVWSGNYYGHVAVVEEVYSDGSILISESSYNGYIFKTKVLTPESNYSNGYGLTFKGFYMAPEIDQRIQEYRLEQLRIEQETLAEVYENTQARIIIQPPYENVLLAAAATPTPTTSIGILTTLFIGLIF